MVNGYEPDDFLFDAVAAFGRTVNLNGSSQEHNHFCNGTLISPRLMLMAKHCGPSNLSADPTQQPNPGTYTFRFRRNVDGSIGSTSQGWESFHQVGVDHFVLSENSSDIMIAVLQEEVTHIQPIEIGNPTDFSAGQAIHVAGWGKEGPAFNQGPRGRLLVADSALNSVSGSWVSFPSAWSSSNPCECGPNMFDSGGAVFVRGSRLVEVAEFAQIDNKYLGISSSSASISRLASNNDMQQEFEEEDYLQLIGVITTTGGGTRVDAHTRLSEFV